MIGCRDKTAGYEFSRLSDEKKEARASANHASNSEPNNSGGNSKAENKTAACRTRKQVPKAQRPQSAPA